MNKRPVEPLSEDFMKAFGASSKRLNDSEKHIVEVTRLKPSDSAKAYMSQMDASHANIYKQSHSAPKALLQQIAAEKAKRAEAEIASTKANQAKVRSEERSERPYVAPSKSKALDKADKEGNKAAAYNKRLKNEEVIVEADTNVSKLKAAIEKDSAELRKLDPKKDKTMFNHLVNKIAENKKAVAFYMKEEAEDIQEAVMKLDKVNHVHAGTAEEKAFARDYVKGHKGDYAEGGPTAEHEKHSNDFHSKYTHKSIKSGFAGSGTAHYTHKASGKTFEVRRTPNGKTFYGTDHNVAHINEEVSEDYDPKSHNGTYTISKRRNGEYGVSQKTRTGHYPWDHAVQQGTHKSVSHAKAWIKNHAGTHEHDIVVRKD